MEVAKRNKPTDYQVLNDLFSGKCDESDLTSHVREKLLRVRAVYAQLLEGKGTYQIVTNLTTEHSVSQAQAYRELNLTEKLFGKVRKSNKAIKRQIAENMALEAYRIAKEAKDAKVMASAAKAYIDATGCAIDDPEMPDFEKIQPSINIITVSDELLKRIEGSMSKGPVIRKPEDYAEYTEITENA